MAVRFIVFLTSAALIFRGTDISKCFRESLGIRDNESRLYKYFTVICSKTPKMHFDLNGKFYVYCIFRHYCLLSVIAGKSSYQRNRNIWRTNEITWLPAAYLLSILREHVSCLWGQEGSTFQWETWLADPRRPEGWHLPVVTEVYHFPVVTENQWSIFFSHMPRKQCPLLSFLKRKYRNKMARNAKNQQNQLILFSKYSCYFN